MLERRMLVFLLWAALGTAACQSDRTVSSHAPVDDSTRSERLAAELEDETAATVMVVAHRACWSNGAPENSLSAIYECEQIGADIIEIDVAVTADGVPVLLHDETVDRTTDGIGRIAELSLADIRGLRLRVGPGGPGSELTNERIPTLEEALQASKDKFLINLDVKAEVFDQAYAVVRSLAIEEQILMKMSALPDDPRLRSADFVGQTLFMPIIRQCMPQNNGAPCSASVSEVAPDFAPYNPIAYEIIYADADYFREGIAVMQGMRSRIWVNTLEPRHAAGHTDALAVSDPDAHWGQVVRDGANIIQTDRPALLLSYLRSQGLRAD